VRKRSFRGRAKRGTWRAKVTFASGDRQEDDDPLGVA
jgi:hypothetical protein